MYFAALSPISNSYLTDRMVQQPMHAMHHRHHHDHHDHHDHHLCRRGIDHSKHHCDTSIGGFQPGGSSDGSKMARRKEEHRYFHLFCGMFHFASIIGQHVFCSIPVWDVFDNPSSPSITSDTNMIVAHQCVARVTMEASHPIISMSFTLGKNILRRRKFSSVDISSLLITIGSALCQVWWLTGGAWVKIATISKKHQRTKLNDSALRVKFQLDLFLRINQQHS